MKVFLFVVFSIIFLFFSSCSLKGNDWLALQDSNEDCDIFTERCPRSGSGFSISGGGRARSSSRRTPISNPLPSGTTISPEIEKAIIYACNQYEEMKEKIEDGISINVGMGRLEFERHIILIPEFDSVNGCLRVESIDDPITRDDESDEFEMICIEDDPNYLGMLQNDREILMNLIQDREETSPEKWLEEVEELSSLARGFLFNTWGRCDNRSPNRNIPLQQPRRINELKAITQNPYFCKEKCKNFITNCKTRCDELETENKKICDRLKAVCESESRTDCESAKTECYELVENITPECKQSCELNCTNSCEGLEPIGEIYMNREILQGFLRNLTAESQTRLSHNKEELIEIIDEIYILESELMGYRAKRTVCRIEREFLNSNPSENSGRIAFLDNTLSALDGDLTSVLSQIREKDEEFLNFPVSEITNLISDRISPEDRENLMRRLLERMRRKMVRKFFICAYTEDDDCLEPREENALQAEIAHVGEFKDFVERQYVDKYATRLECENLNLPPSSENNQQDRNRRELNQLCGNYYPEEDTLLAFTRAECRDTDRVVSCGADPIALKDDERFDEEKVDQEIDILKKRFKDEFLPYFQQPFGLACPEPEE